MGTEALSPVSGEALHFAGGLSERFLRHFRLQVEDWHDVCRKLSLWEERHLAENPADAVFEEHLRILDELGKTGRWLSMLAESHDFPDRSAAELIHMTLQDLRDRRALWHGPMNKAQRERLLDAIFHEP